jgi:hypothetical protein
MFMPAPSGSVVEGASHARPDSLGLEVVRHCAPCVLVHTAATAPLVVPRSGAACSPGTRIEEVATVGAR